MRAPQGTHLRMSVQALPKEKERLVTDTQSEVRFLMSDKLKAKLEGVRALLGAKGATMTYAELFDVMSDLSISALESKHFGKKRTQESKTAGRDSGGQDSGVEVPKDEALDSTSKVDSGHESRYISKALKHQVWQKYKGVCTNCGGQRNVQFDHIKPHAVGGPTTFENLRLLCFQCNQRASIKVFGIHTHKHPQPTGCQ